MEQAQIDLLVIDAKLGKDIAFEQLFNYFQQGLLRYAYKVSSDPQIAQEATQNSWIKVTKNLAKLKDPRAFKSWLFQLTHWQVLDLLRKQKIHDQYIDIEEVDELSSAAPVNENSELYFQLSQLENIDKQAIHLFYLEEMSLQEISIVLSIPIGTVKSRLNRARNTLKNKLSNQ
jgi:RNA polymerase sigma-70 factor (ECF subfamily)